MTREKWTELVSSILLYPAYGYYVFKLRLARIRGIDLRVRPRDTFRGTELDREVYGGN